MRAGVTVGTTVPHILGVATAERIMHFRFVLPTAAAALIVAGAPLAATGHGALAHALWMTGLVVTGLPLALRTARAALHGRFATDLVATLSIIGSVALDQPLAGLVIVLMQSGGEA